MDSFCTNCGTPIPEGAEKCESCGKEFTQEAPQQPAQEQPATEYQESAQQPEQPKMKKSMLYGIIGAAAAVVIILIIILTSVISNSYKKAIDNYLDVLIRGQADKIEKLAPKEYWEYYEDEYDTDLNDIVDSFENTYEYLSEALEKEYGKNIKVSYKITDKNELSDKKLSVIRDTLKDDYGIAKKSVSKAYKVEIKMTIKGSDDKDTEETDLIVVKIGSGWYICDADGELLSFL